MATPLVRRDSYDRFREGNDDEQESSYVCACGQVYMSEEFLKKHQQKDCKNRSFSCSFCQETFATPAVVRDHLLLCGNKTDQCPNCRQLIRRSHFAYHYENNCAPVNEVETPPNARKNRSIQNFPPNSNRPYLREDIPNDDYPSMYPTRINDKIQSSISHTRGSSGIIECEYCHNECAQNDYPSHRNVCLRNPINANQRPQPSRTPLKPNQSSNNSNSIAHIPCEFCNELIDLPNWSIHTQECRERYTKRNADVARTMSREPVTEQLPCEYCQKLFSAKQLHPHEETCPRNPDRMNAAAALAHRPLPRSVFLPTTSNNNRNHPFTQNIRGPQNVRTVYQSIDVDRTHDANRSHNNNRLNKNNQQPMRRTPSDEVILIAKNPPHGVRTYDDELPESYEHPPYENISQSSRQRPPNGISRHPGSSSDDLRDEQNQRNIVAGNRKPQLRPPYARGNLEVIDNSPDRPYTKKHKKSIWKRLFCASNNGYNSD